MKPTDELMAEHQNVLVTLEILNKISHDIRSGKPVAQEDLSELMEVLRLYVDQCHHGKEENILFPSIEALGIPRDAGPTGVMFSEHDNGRQFIQGMRDALADFHAGGSKSLIPFADNAEQYSTLMQQHIYKEDNILYPMANAHFDSAKQTSVQEDFNRITQELGPGGHERFEVKIGMLADKYLKS